jgi:hypothetical protein
LLTVTEERTEPDPAPLVVVADATAVLAAVEEPIAATRLLISSYLYVRTNEERKSPAQILDTYTMTLEASAVLQA